MREHDIRFAMLLDIQPVSHVVSPLRQAGVRCVVSYWGAPISSPVSGVRLWLKRAGVRLAGPRRVDSLIFESQAMADLAVCGRGCPPWMLDVVYLGTDISRFRPTSEKSYIQSTFGIGPDKVVVLFSGHAHERKGIGTLLDCAVLLHRNQRREDLFFLICGDRGDESERWLQRVRGTGAEHAIRFGSWKCGSPGGALLFAAFGGGPPRKPLRCLGVDEICLRWCWLKVWLGLHFQSIGSHWGHIYCSHGTNPPCSHNDLIPVVFAGIAGGRAALAGRWIDIVHIAGPSMETYARNLRRGRAVIHVRVAQPQRARPCAA